MVLKRLLQPSIIQNEKDVNYRIPSLKSNEVYDLLSTKYVGGGVFGLESIYNQHQHNTTFFCQPHYKTEWGMTKRDLLFENLIPDENYTLAQYYTTKPSIFPTDMYHTESLWNQLCTLTNKNMTIMYQLLLIYRQDNWKERLQEMYDDFIYNGIEQPFNNGFLRKIQRTVNEKIDTLLKWENQHLPIQEFADKINENAFRCNFRLIVKGDTERERKKLIKQFKDILNDHSYMNHWDVIISKLNDENVEEIRCRRINNIGKSQVYSESELIPFLTMNEIKQVEVVNEVVEINQPIVESVSSGNNLIALLPKGEGLKDFDGSKLADKFANALKEIKGINKSIVAKRWQSGSTLMKISFDIPKGLKFSDLIKRSTIDDLQAYIGIKNLSIEQGDEGEFNVTIPLPERQIIYLGDYISSDKFLEYSKNSYLGVCVGADEIGNPIYRDLAEAPHLLLAGTTGSGKSSVLNAILLQLLLTKSPNEVIFYHIDIKRTELGIYKQFPHTQKVCLEPEESITLLKQLISEMYRRYKLFEQHNVRDIKGYNRRVRSNPLPRIVLCIDEYAELKNRCEENVDEYIESLCGVSRASGITVILATQRPSVNVINGTIKGNIPSKICLKCADIHSYKTILDTSPKFKLLGKGDGILSFDGSIEHVRFQSCLITDKDEVELIEQIAKYMREGKVNLELPEVVEMKEETDLDRIKKIIVNSGETRVAELRKLLGLKMDTTTELMNQLVSENFLEKSKSRREGYKLIASEEILNQYRNEENSPQP